MKKKQKIKKRKPVKVKKVRKSKKDALIEEMLKIQQHDGFYEGGF